mmetsp:Transcript_17999/g.28462  ORF Transcript_17999/g.28462 Transcript_17999/m.28462 type:complete len:218 (-) Transcript_17999:213-866(-)
MRLAQVRHYLIRRNRQHCIVDIIGDKHFGFTLRRFQRIKMHFVRVRNKADLCLLLIIAIEIVRRRLCLFLIIIVAAAAALVVVDELFECVAHMRDYVALHALLAHIDHKQVRRQLRWPHTIFFRRHNLHRCVLQFLALPTHVAIDVRLRVHFIRDAAQIAHPMVVHSVRQPLHKRINVRAATATTNDRAILRCTAATKVDEWYLFVRLQWLTNDAKI